MKTLSLFVLSAVLVSGTAIAAPKPTPTPKPTVAARPAPKPTPAKVVVKPVAVKPVVAAAPAPAPKPRVKRAPAAPTGRMVTTKTKTGKTITYNCSLPGNANKTACK